MKQEVTSIGFSIELLSAAPDCRTYTIEWDAGDNLEWQDDEEIGFGFRVFTVSGFLNQFKDSGYFEDDVDVIGWNTGDYIVDDIRDADNLIDIAAINSSVVVSANPFEIDAKFGLWFIHNRPWTEKKGYYGSSPFGLYNNVIGNGYLNFEFSIISFNAKDRNDSFFELKCAVRFDDGFVFDFDVLACNLRIFPKYRRFNNNKTYVTLIWFTKFNIDYIKMYLKECFMYIKASSKEELLLKICTMSNTAYSADLFSVPLATGQKYRLEYRKKPTSGLVPLIP
jgi:hypothetical protein